MKRKIIALIIIIVISGAAAAGLYFYKQRTAPPPVAHTTHEEAKEVSQAQAEEAEETPLVEISPEKQQMMGVKTAAVDFQPLQKIIRTVGRVEYDERRITTITTHIEGWIEKLFVNYTGRYVKKGEPLLSIYSHELISTQEEYLIAFKWRQKQSGTALEESAASLLNAARKRLYVWDISDKQIEEIEKLGRPVKALTIYSPVEGYVSEKAAFEGMMIKAGEPLFKIADLSNLWIIADIYEYELPFVKPGDASRIALSYLPGREFSSKIDYIYPSLSAETRTAKVRFSIPNTGAQLMPQMFTGIEIKIGLGRKLAVPDDAVIDTGTRQVVYVDKGDGYFEPREVMLGLRAEGLREVLAGLKKGEKIAVSANFLIDSEAQLKGVKPLGHKH
ncbi:MAG: efflux RND transporter periplasmic adaptor subunit [Nitrospirae bacterium]|nr:efflux RND transporter periplasmic adaptor subunit [Nitrospirota bacterium]